MVLRGSGIAPDHHLNTEVLKKDKEELKVVESELKSTEQEALNKLVVLGDRKNSTREQTDAAVKELAKAAEHLEELKQKKRMKLQDFDIHNKEFIKTAKQLLCGGAAGAIARTTVAPLDRVKILIQTAHVRKTTHLYPNMFETVKYILRTEGPTGLWRGNFTNCVRVVPHSATQFTAYDRIKVFMIGSSDGKLEVWQRLIAGSLSGVAATTVTQPLDVVRIRLQTDPEVRGKIGVAARAMWSEGGVATFYKGYTAAVLSLAPFIALNFTVFDYLKLWYYGDKKCTKDELKARNPLVVLTLGGLSGIIAQTICYPLDTVRRRQQLKGRVYSSTGNAFITIFKEEGALGFYRGMIPNALKVIPNNSIRFMVYEVLKNWFVEE